MAQLKYAYSLTRNVTKANTPIFVGLLHGGYGKKFIWRWTERRSYSTDCRELFHPISGKRPVYKSSEEAVSVIKSGDHVFVHGIPATPTPLLEAMTVHGKKNKLEDVKVVHVLTEGPAPHTKPDCEGIFRDNSLFIGGNVREAVNEGRADSTPVFLGEIPLLFHRKIIPVDVALVQVTPPDRHGYCSLGPSVDCTRAALQNAKYIIGLSNIHFPRTFGDGNVHMSHIDVMVEGNHPMPETKRNIPSDVEKKIGELIAQNLVQDGATLQMVIEEGLPGTIQVYVFTAEREGYKSPSPRVYPAESRGGEYRAINLIEKTRRTLHRTLH